MEVKPEIKIEESKPLAEIDEFEEDTDLQFPSDTNAQSWLIKVSEDMWKAWNTIYQDATDDTHIKIGTLRVFHPPPGQENNHEQKLQICLDDEREENKKLPKKYNIEIKATGYNNTVVFSEKDLPGHASRPFNAHSRLNPRGHGGINKGDRYGQPQQARKPGTYRTAIPKQTALAPQIQHEAIANPVEDADTLDYFAAQYRSALTAGNKTKFIGSQKTRHPGQDSESFLLGSYTSKPGKGKKKVPKEKAVRMDKDKLLDALRNCFKEYQYWSLKALRGRLNQPEAYIKETLGDLAILVRSGDFVQTYKLRPEFEKILMADDAVAQMAPVKQEGESDEGTGDEMDEDDDADFEDVKMDS